MIVVADTSPLNYLILINEIDILPQVFGTILVPTAVASELQSMKAAPAVRSWIASPPSWIKIRAGSAHPIPALIELDPGEREAIQLAVELGIETVLMDDAFGRSHAEMFHLQVRGTLGVLERAAQLGEVDLHEALAALLNTNFRVSNAVLDDFLMRNAKP